MHTMGFNCLKTAEPQGDSCLSVPRSSLYPFNWTQNEKAESTVEPPSGFEPRTNVLGIQRAKRVLARKEKKFCILNELAGLHKLHAVTTMCVTCIQNTSHIHENLCTILIPLCKYDLNLPMFLISNTAVSNPYSHSTGFDPQSFLPLS